MGKIRRLSTAKIPFLFSILFLFLVCSRDLKAFELYRLLNGDCSTSPGLIIHADEVSIDLLTVDGDLQTVERSTVKNILVYNILDNPISLLKLSGGIGKYLREVESTHADSKGFIAWPIRFIENLIVFYDIEGKTHLIEIDKLKSFTVPEQAQFKDQKLEKAQTYHFGYGDSLMDCPSNGVQDGRLILPTRTLGDQIRINKFLSIFQKGFLYLDQFQQRTYFYAKPYLYEEQTKLGITITHDDYQEEPPSFFPGYIQWSSGSPYSSQGIYSFGNRPLEIVPNVEPMFAFYSAVKSHFFQASFAGNPNGFAAGSDFLIAYRALYEDFLVSRDLDNPFIITQFNYVAISGIGIKEYYLGAGFYYPIYGIYGNEKFREILSTKTSPIVQFHYTLPSSKFQIIASKTDLGSNDPNEDDIILIYGNELINPELFINDSKETLLENLERFEFHSSFLRIGFEIDSTEEFSYSIYEIIQQGEYEEVISGNPYRLKYNHLITAVNSRLQFGDFLTLKGGLNYFRKFFHSETSDETEDYQVDKFSVFVGIEFIL